MIKYNLTKLAYSIEDLLEILPIGRSKLNHEVNAGKLKASKIGKSIVFLADDVAEYLQGLPKKIINKKEE